MSIGAIVISLVWVVFFVLALRQPFYGVMGYYWLTLMRPQDIWFYTYLGQIRLSYYLAAVTILSVFIHRARLDQEKISFYPVQSILFFIFWIGIALSYLFSYNQEISWNNFLLFTKMVLFYYVAYYCINNKKQFLWMIWMVIIAIGYMSYFANDAYFFGGFPLPIMGPGYGFYSDNNIFAMLFVIGIPFCYFMAQMSKNRVFKVGLFVVMITMIHSVILTFSRGGFLGMAASSAEALIRTKKKWVAIVVGGIAFVLFLQLWGGGSRERMMTIFLTSEGRDASAQSRIVAWEAGFKAFSLHPWTGVGLDMFEHAVPRIIKGAGGLVAHNAYIQMFAEAGILAGGSLIALILISLIDLRRIRKKAKAGEVSDEVFHYTSMLRSAFAGYIVSSMFLSLDTFEPLYLLILLVIVLKKLVLKGEFDVEKNLS